MELKYNEKYNVVTIDGSKHIAFYRKSEDYDWWEEDETWKEIKYIDSYCSHIADKVLGDKQINLINWMFNYCRISMLKRNDEHSQTDIETLIKYIDERFPNEADQIQKLIR